MRISGTHSVWAAWSALLALVAPSAAIAQDDIVLFSTNVQPNVLMILDNSFSMEEIVWHPAFDPNATYPCAAYQPEEIVLFNIDTTTTGYYTIDFNQAYNPYCAYNDTYECPYPPPPNRLDALVLAGEQAPEG